MNGSNLIFTLNTVAHLHSAKPRENVVCSPIGLEMAFAMAALGARGETLSEMLDVLGRQDSLTAAGTLDAHRYASLLSQLKGSQLGVQLSMAQALYTREGYDLEDAYVSSVVKHFAGQAHSRDFNQSDEVRDEMNNWVELVTKGQIKELIKEVQPNVIAYLLAANSYKGDWTIPFELKHTRDEPFHTPGGIKQVPLMHRTGGFKMGWGKNFTTAALPMGPDEKVTLYCILPRDGTSMSDVLSGLKQSFEESRRTLRKDNRAELRLPRVKSECAIDLVPVMKGLGMKRAFTAGAADFSGMYKSQGLYIAQAVHKAFWEFDEKGVKAASATGIGMGLESLPPQIRLDKPFIALLMAEPTSTVLFAGIINDPSC